MAESTRNEHAPDEEVASGTSMPFDKRYLSKVGFVVQKVVHTWPTKKAIEEQEQSKAPDERRKPYHLLAPQSLDDLDFVPQPMVGWYQPKELVTAGIRAVVSAVFGAYADKREVESVLTREEWHDYSRQTDLWIDYVADLGDGWDATYTVARLLAEQQLTLPHAGRSHPTQRGHLLVMGGDEVYPTATREEYENRLIHPYRCALPFVEYTELAPHLYLIPGNHDWYDGLNSFFKLFCQGGWVGGWRTWQRRSYFALKLDDGLWLWGIDLQLSSNIDKPQLDYFKHVAMEQMATGSKIILCTAEPSWVYTEAKTKEKKGSAKEKARQEIYHNLGHLDKWTIKPNGHEILVGLAGDWHNYTRYALAGEKHSGAVQSTTKQYQRFVCGGGGAYLYPTHNMPKTLDIPNIPDKTGPREFYERAEIFPDEAASKALAAKSLFFAFYRLNWGFTAFLGAFYLLLAWIVQSVSKVAMGSGNTLLDSFNTGGFVQGVTDFFNIIAHSPGSVVFLLLLVVGLIGFSGYESLWKKVLHGGLHGLAHVALFLALIYLFAWFNLDVLGLGVDHPVQVALFGVEMLVFGGFLGGVALGIYLWFSFLFLKIHDNEVLLCQSNPDYKNFLRFHVNKKDREITIYPVGVERVNRKRSWSFDKTKRQLAAWALQPNARGGTAWFEPKNGQPIHTFARLIEEPIVLGYGDGQATRPETTKADAAA